MSKRELSLCLFFTVEMLLLLIGYRAWVIFWENYQYPFDLYGLFVPEFFVCAVILWRTVVYYRRLKP